MPEDAPSGLLDRFARLDTGTVSDALDQLGLPGAVAGIDRLGARVAIVGFAETVQLTPADGTPSTRHLGAAAIEVGTTQSVIVVAGGRLDCGGWGGLLSRAAAAKGIRGVIVDGASRDIDEAVELGFPVYARASTPVTARGRQRELTSGEPVSIGGVAISSGDIVLADGTGVVVVPRDRAADILAAAESIDEREQLLIGRIDDGESAAVVLGGNYENMLAQVEAR